MNPRTTPADQLRDPPPATTPRRSIWAGLAIAAGAATLAACGGAAVSSTGTNPPSAVTAAPGNTAGATSSAGGGQVLPVTVNPINNTATDVLLAIDSVLVENNVDPATGKDASDHLEVAVSNTGTTELEGFEVYYTFDDKIAGVTESYHAQLPADFTVTGGSSRLIHFDNTGARDHFADNQFSLYHTSLNPMDVTVEVSATDAAPQTMTVQKDKGGDEVAD